MTGGGHVLHHGVGGRAPHQQSNVAPRFLFIQSVERMTGSDAGFAARTAVQFDFEGVLLSRTGGGGGNEFGIVAGLRGQAAQIMGARELLDGGHLLLIVQ